MNKILTLTFHIAFLALAIFSLRLISNIPDRYLPILELLPFVLTALSFILGYRFNRSLVIYSALLFTLVYSYLFFAPLAGHPQQVLALNSIAILLAANVALLCFYSERGIFTPIGLIRFVLIVVQVCAIGWLVQQQQAQWQNLVNQIVFPALQIKLVFFSQVALLVMLVSVIVISSSYLTRSNPFRSAIFASLLLLLYAISLPPKEILNISVLISFALALPLLTLISESYRMAFVDELTDLPGRRALNETMNKLGNKYVLAMLDVDHFKKFNDTYGHDAGDDVLHLLGNRLKNVSGGGKPFRYGGEEFAVVFFGASLEDVEEHLEDLREGVANKKFALRKQERRQKKASAKKKNNQRFVNVTISIGYAEKSAKNTNPTAVLKAADKALYKAKKKGRNCIST